MTFLEFRQMIEGMASERMGLSSYADYLKQKKQSKKWNPNKYLREEYLPILAVLNALNIEDDEQIELGNETEKWDARLSSGELFEVVQALPEAEYEIRLEIASGGASPATYFKHSGDHLQFPQAIMDAIQLKHDMDYPEPRMLIVVFDGDYSFEDDAVINGWIQEVRLQVQLGIFKNIFLVERARLKVFTIL